LLNDFFCDKAIIDKTLFDEIVCWQSVKFDANFEYILNFAEV